MHCLLITLFPEMLDLLNYGVIGRAREQGRLALTSLNPRDFASDTYHTVDDRPYGGGPGMVMKPEPLCHALQAAQKKLPHAKKLYLSPQGEPLTHAKVLELAQHPELILLAGRYEGVDERIIEQEIDAEISIGDFIVSGGELPALLLIDAIARVQPGVLGDAESAQQDSFMADRLDHPCYTRPEVFNGQAVPNVLLSGDHKAIARWRHKQSIGKTWQKRPDLLKRRVLTADESALLAEFIAEQTGQKNEQNH